MRRNKSIDPSTSTVLSTKTCEFRKKPLELPLIDDARRM